MLKTRALEKYLSQGSGPGVTDIMLFNKEGSSSAMSLEDSKVSTIRSPLSRARVELSGVCDVRYLRGNRARCSREM